MHFFESWHCKPKFSIEVHHKTDFDSYNQALDPAVKPRDDTPSTYSIYLVCETEVNVDHEPFAYATNVYGNTKHSLLYPAQQDGKKMFLIVPTQSEPRKLSIEPCGKAHAASHYGALLAQSILALPMDLTTDALYCITLSDHMKNIIEGEQQEFLLGILQRSVSHKVKKSRLHEKKIGMQTILFRSELFSESVLHKANTMSFAMSITRTLINMPANILNPETYEDCVQFLVDKYSDSVSSRGQTAGSRLDPVEVTSPLELAPRGQGDISMEVFDNEHLKNLGCGLICAVGQGSSVPPRVVKLTYQPKEEWIPLSSSGMTLKHVALVGKGITFDSGGYDIKPAGNMRNMKKDMGGSAAVLGTFFASAQLNLPLKITCYLAIAENMVSGNAMRPGDIYKAHNGLNVEIDNTDAEGRLVLADALSLATQDKPDWIVDLATLTGAARTSLGPLIDSAFGNRNSFNHLLNSVSLETGDWVWNLPLPPQYEPYFDSRIADMMNSTTTPFAGSITAALFLQKFVGTCAWNHIDTFMWCDRAQGLWGEDNAPTAKCVRLMVRALEHYCFNELT